LYIAHISRIIAANGSTYTFRTELDPVFGRNTDKKINSLPDN